MFFFKAEENDGEPVDDLALMRRAYTNKKTGQIDDGLVRDVVDLVQTQVVDEVSQLQTEDDASTASTNLSRFRINEIVESVSSFFLKFNSFISWFKFVNLAIFYSVGSKEEGTFGRFGSSHPVGSSFFCTTALCWSRSTYGSVEGQGWSHIFVGDPDGGSTGGLWGTEEAEPANDGDDAEDVPERGVPGRARPVVFFFSKNSECFIFICETLNIN